MPLGLTLPASFLFFSYFLSNFLYQTISLIFIFTAIFLPFECLGYYLQTTGFLDCSDSKLSEVLKTSACLPLSLNSVLPFVHLLLFYVLLYYISLLTFLFMMLTRVVLNFRASLTGLRAIQLVGKALFGAV